MSINSSNSTNTYLTIKIISPESTVFADKAEMITVPSIEGELGFLPAHLPVIFQIKSGLIKLYNQSAIQYVIFTNNGYGQLVNDILTITCEYAIDLAKTSKSQNETAITELNEKITKLSTSENSNEYKDLLNKLNIHNLLAEFLK